MAYSYVWNAWATMYRDGEVYDGEWVPLTDAEHSVIAGYRYLNHSYVLCIMFELQAPTKRLIFNLQNYTGTSGFSGTMRYKFTRAPDATLHNADFNTPGDGNFSVTQGDNKSYNVVFDRVFAAGIHYIYIWTDLSTSYPYNTMRIRWHRYLSAEYTGFSIAYEPGIFVFIDDETGHRAYEPYIDNGIAYAPYGLQVDNGAGWTAYG